jgi:hypothetical protein
MAVAIEQIRPGAVFRFKNGPRRVIEFAKPVGSGFNTRVRWEYADGKKRGGRLTGTQWVHYFRAKAIEEIPDPAVAGDTLRLLSGREVATFKDDSCKITVDTNCPAKWAFVDLETGELWGHDGTKLRHLSPAEAAEVEAVAKQAAANKEPQ